MGKQIPVATADIDHFQKLLKVLLHPYRGESRLTDAPNLFDPLVASPDGVKFLKPYVFIINAMLRDGVCWSPGPL
jgi:hypothetical protein